MFVNFIINKTARWDIRYCRIIKAVGLSKRLRDISYV